MDLTQDKLDLISNIIKGNSKFSGHEDLFDEIFDEVCNRSKTMISLINSDDELEKYIKKIATTSILTVLKTSHKPVLVNQAEPQEIEHTNCKEYAKEKISYNKFPLEKFETNLRIQPEILERVTNIVSKIDDEEPNNQYLQIYKLRYESGMTQKEITNTLGLSQAEVSKRLFQLMEKVKKSLG